jgi:hypothetical protein
MSRALPATRSALSYYRGSIGLTALVVAFSGWAWGLQAAFLAFVLAVLEVSLSLDNAVVNAKILENWDARWRRMFLTWGVLVAVFGMRLLFPVIVVCAATGLDPYTVARMALYHPDEYARHMSSAHYQIAGFGGAFLMMVALSFFFEERDQRWLEWAERKLSRFGQIEGVTVAGTLGALFLARHFVHATAQNEFFVAGVLGVVCFVLAHGLGTLFGQSEEADPVSIQPGGTFVRAGVAGFLFIELLDASFSFDGVIGAFVLTTYLPLIMLGLGAGALFVRSFTVHLVEAGTLSTFRYLEHGAFYAILTLAGVMLTPEMHLPEWVPGLSGAVILGLALLHSHLTNRREARGSGPEALPASQDHAVA